MLPQMYNNYICFWASIHATIDSTLVTSHSITPGNVKEKLNIYRDLNTNTTFQKVKPLISKLTAYPCSSTRDLLVITQADTSKHGLVAFLLQNGKHIAFALKSLTDTEA